MGTSSFCDTDTKKATRVDEMSAAVPVDVVSKVTVLPTRKQLP